MRVSKSSWVPNDFEMPLELYWIVFNVFDAKEEKPELNAQKEVTSKVNCSIVSHFLLRTAPEEKGNMLRHIFDETLLQRMFTLSN